MLGPAKPRRHDQPIAVSLEALVPADHFYRHLEEKLNLSFVRDWARELYAEGVRPVQRLIETASLNLAHRWYLGYALDGALPDHSSLTRMRQQFGINAFQRFFEQVVDLCQAAGLVWGSELYVDATKVAANADVDSLVPRLYSDARIASARMTARRQPSIRLCPGSGHGR